jgi:large subunit ribosomal protein L6
MSRLGKKPLPIPEKVKVEFKNHVLEIAGPLGKRSQEIPAQLDVKIDKNELLLLVGDQTRETNMLHGLFRGLVKNDLDGVTHGFKKDLEIHGLGFKANPEGQNVVVFQIGYSHPIHFPIPVGIKITIDKQTLVSVSGVDKRLVGEVASSIRALKPPEPYKGTGIRYAGEHIIKKVGKTAAGAAAPVSGGK